MSLVPFDLDTEFDVVRAPMIAAFITVFLIAIDDQQRESCRAGDFFMNRTGN